MFMANHPNRGRRDSPAASPTADQVKAAREAAKLTQQQAADLIYYTLNGWQKWEQGERNMPAGLFELFRIKVAGRYPLDEDPAGATGRVENI